MGTGGVGVAHQKNYHLNGEKRTDEVWRKVVEIPCGDLLKTEKIMKNQEKSRKY